jgi:hypothetical protein
LLSKHIANDEFSALFFELSGKVGIGPAGPSSPDAFQCIRDVADEPAEWKEAGGMKCAQHFRELLILNRSFAVFMREFIDDDAGRTSAALLIHLRSCTRQD